MAVTARVLFQITLMIFLRRIETRERCDFHAKAFMVLPFDLHDALYRPVGILGGGVNAGLILRAYVVALPVGGGWVDHGKVGKEEGVEARLFRIVNHANRFTVPGRSAAYILISGVFRVAVCVAAYGVRNARQGTHELFKPPKASAGQIDFTRCQFSSSLSACHIDQAYCTRKRVPFILRRHDFPKRIGQKKRP